MAPFPPRSGRGPVSSGLYTVEDSVLKATLSDLGGGRWLLNIQPKQGIGEEYFPWQSNRAPLSADIANDIYYYPLFGGMSEKASNRNNDWDWYGMIYPGQVSAPLTVVASDQAAKIVAATNWPAKEVTPLYGGQRMILYYTELVAAGGSANYSALIASVTGNAAQGNTPWQNALDLYKAWLDANRGPINYPAWMWQGEGFFDVQLEGLMNFSTADLDAEWEPVKNLYPWVLMWGQMSPYAGGCCGVDPNTMAYYPTAQQMNARYQPSLPNWVKNNIVGQGMHAGYYSSPYQDPQTGANKNLDTPAGLSWLTSWLSTNKNTYGANSYYIDIFARDYFGDPAKILALFANGTLPADAVNEGIVDIYPIPGLMSGQIVGTASLCGAPYKTPQMVPTTTYPKFMRYLLNDRIMFSGSANTDWRFWGSGSWSDPTDSFDSACAYANWCAQNGPCDHGTERSAFILGNKLDVEVYSTAGNPVLDAITQAREGVNWFARKPKFVDNRGLNLSGIPASSKVEITRFLDMNGATLIAISNPKLVSGLSFMVDGKAVAVPPQSIAVIDLGK
jgi:hypothetical protein